MKPHIQTALILTVLLAAPLAWAQSGGGTIQNTDPTITSGLTGSVGSTTNVAAVTETFTFTVKDTNGEADLQGVKITSTAFGTKECLAPFSCSNWNLTDAASGDGVLSFTYTHKWPAGQAAGSYTQTASVRDEGSYVAGSTTDATTFSNAPQVEGSSSTHHADGSVDGDAWGGWSATPGDSLVSSSNYLKATNTGTSDGVVTVSFTDTAFASASGGSIDIDGNIRFHYGTGSSPSVANLQETLVDGDGSYTFDVPAGSTLWIAYELMALPSILPDATDYQATFSFA